jgi:hypothetical protein
MRAMPGVVRGVGPETGGVMLIIAGAAFALQRFTSIEGVWRWLPLFAVYLAARDLRHRTPEPPPTTVPLLAAIWLQIVALELFGFDFLNGWPLLVVLVGLGLVIDGLVGGSRPEPTPHSE